MALLEPKVGVRSFTVFILWLLCFTYSASAQDTIASAREIDNIYTATAKTTKLNIDLSSPEDVELVLKKLHGFKFLESVTFEGVANESDLKKIFYRMSVLKNISSVTFVENELLKIPDNLSALKNLQSLTVEGNRDLDYTDLFLHLKGTKVNEINLIDNDIKKAPSTLAELSSLKKLQISGSNQMDYYDLVEYISKLPFLTTLSIPLNYITDLPKNIDKLRSLLVLDVSNNELTELPGEISGLKVINNLSIQGNLLLDPVKDLEKLKGNNIQYLSLDKEISGDDLEKIKKMFPDAQIDFPVNKEEEPIEVKPTETVTPKVYSGEIGSKNETTVLSGAYMSYPTFFQGLVYSFDTLRFDERYSNLQYENVRRIVTIAGVRGTACLYMRTKCLRLEKPGKKDEIWFRFATDDPRVSASYPELRAFGGMYWVYSGNLSKRKFHKKFLKRRMRPEYRTIFGWRARKRKMPIRWNDVRIDFEKNNSLFKITLKCDTGFVSFNAFPVIPTIDLERSQATYYRRHQLYKKSLLRRAQRFNKGLARAKATNDREYKTLTNYAWKEVQLRMSNEEKAMSKEDWLKYYDNVIANEQKALDNANLVMNYIQRSLQIRNYSVVTVGSQFSPTLATNVFGAKAFNCDLMDSRAADSKLVVNSIFVIDNKTKIITQYNGSLGFTPDLIPIKQFTSQTLLVELRNGNWAYVSSSELDKEPFDPNKVFKLQAQVFDKNLDTIGDLLKAALK